MIIRPKERDYIGFVELIKEGLKGHEDVCFYTYGSSLENKMSDVGRSDIDGGLIVDANAVISKERVRFLAKLLSSALEKHRVRIHINLTDRLINKDGRFLSYTEDFTDWIKKTAIVHSGQRAFIEEMMGLQYKSGPLESIAMNLRTLRNSILNSFYQIRNNYYDFEVSFEENALERLSRLSKKILWLIGREIIPSRFKAQKELQNIFPRLDLSYLSYVNKLLSNPQQIDDILKCPTLAQSIYQDSLQQYERIIREYVKKFPDVSKREANF